MSTGEERKRLVHEAYAALSARDLDAFESLTHPDCVADWSRSRGPYGGIYEGRPAIRRFLTEFFEMWDELDYPTEELIEVDDRIVRVGGMKARGRGSGVEINAKGGQVIEFKGGLVSRIALYQSKEEALEAAVNA